jgi:hypothetical protein
LWNVSEFEANTHRTKSMELLSLKQTGSVDDYRRNFEQLVYYIRLYDSSLNEMMLTSQFIMGLKDEIRHQVELMLPENVAKAVVLAVMQEHLLQPSRKAPRQFPMRASVHPAKSDNKVSPSPATEVWQARQLKEYRRANGLCYRCGKKYAPGHKCNNATSVAQIAALTTESCDGGGILSDDMLNMLEGIHITKGECESYLSLHVLSGTQGNRAIHLRVLIQNPVLSILVDSGSSHTFLNASMVSLLPLQPKLQSLFKLK